MRIDQMRNPVCVFCGIEFEKLRGLPILAAACPGELGKGVHQFQESMRPIDFSVQGKRPIDFSCLDCGAAPGVACSIASGSFHSLRIESAFCGAYDFLGPLPISDEEELTLP